MSTDTQPDRGQAKASLAHVAVSVHRAGFVDSVPGLRDSQAKPGDPVCHIAIPRHGVAPIREALENRERGDVDEKLLDDLASSIQVTKEGE